MAATKVSLKLFIEKESNRVLYAEADKEFVDFLLSIFTLPVGVVTRLLKEEGGMVGSLPSLYQSFENLSVTYIQPSKDKRFVLEPRVFIPGAKLPLLLPNVGSTFRRLYRCSPPNIINTGFNSFNQINPSCSRKFVADDDSTICDSCKCQKDRIVTFRDPQGAKWAFSASEEGYVRGTAPYMVMDDLEVKPLSTTSLVTLLSQFNVKDIRDIKEKVVDVGVDEVCPSLFIPSFLCITTTKLLLLLSVCLLFLLNIEQQSR
jgi:hypothetical protein